MNVASIAWSCNLLCSKCEIGSPDGTKYGSDVMQASRQREIKRMSQHRAIARTLFDAEQKTTPPATVNVPVATATADTSPGAPVATGAGTQNNAPSLNAGDAAAGKAASAGGSAGEEAAGAAGHGDVTTGADAAVLSWKGPKLVPELCGVHPLRLSVWRSLQYIPSLMYRLEVRTSLLSVYSWLCSLYVAGYVSLPYTSALCECNNSACVEQQQRVLHACIDIVKL